MVGVTARSYDGRMLEAFRSHQFVRLSVLPLRGVMDWREVQFEELPPAVQSRMRR